MPNECRTPRKDEDLQPRLERVAAECGEIIADSVLARVATFPGRQKLLKLFFDKELESVPAEILWHGLQEDAAPSFLIYKMLHEAFSNSPGFFRWLIERLLREQSKTYPVVFSRETLWSIVAHHPDFDVPPSLGDPASIAKLLECLNSKGAWNRSADDIQREATHISSMISEKADFTKGVEALRSLQLERGSTFTHGNLMLFVPARLRQFADHVVELGREGELVPASEIWAFIRREIAEPSTEGRHESIPIDLLYTPADEEGYCARILVRSKTDRDTRARYRRQLIYTRYFMAYAFQGVAPERHDVRIAFYLDPAGYFESTGRQETFFEDGDILPQDQFWSEVAANPQSVDLVRHLRATASDKLVKEKLMQRIRDHFRGPREAVDPPVAPGRRRTGEQRDEQGLFQL